MESKAIDSASTYKAEPDIITAYIKGNGGRD
jgi:hypothetical protein